MTRRLDRRSRAFRLARAPKLPNGAAMLYRSALRKALERQQARLWAIIERSYEEPKADTIVTYYDGPRAHDVALGELLPAGADFTRFTDIGARIDAAADGGASRLKGEHIDIPMTTIATVAKRVAKKTADEMKRVAGITRESQGADEKVLAAFRKKNTDLIKSLEKQQVSELRSVLREATEKGWTVRTLRARIIERFEVAKSHADLIARDQTIKLNSDLTRMRHKAAGITEFVWSTSKDERVRESHAELDGERFSWDDLPEVDGEKVAPGEAICCRCVAIAIVPWLEEGSED